MSIESYRANLSRRVTGPNLPTCFPAALEQISPNHSYRPAIYKRYTDYVNWAFSFPTKEWDNLILDAEEMLSELVRPLGNLACEDLVIKRANTPIGFSRIVKPLLRDGYRVTADLWYSRKSIRNVHAVGLLPVYGEKDFVTLVSTHIPKPLEGPVSLSQVAARLAVFDETHMPSHPINDSNIVALPPVT